MHTVTHFQEIQKDAKRFDACSNKLYTITCQQLLSVLVIFSQFYYVFENFLKDQSKNILLAFVHPTATRLLGKNESQHSSAYLFPIKTLSFSSPLERTQDNFHANICLYLPFTPGNFFFI